MIRRSFYQNRKNNGHPFCQSGGAVHPLFVCRRHRLGPLQPADGGPGAAGNFSDFPTAAPAGGAVHRSWDERSGPHHAAALHE